MSSQCAVQRAFEVQANACDELGSPFTASLCRTFLANLDRSTQLGQLCLDWAGDPSPGGDSVPLRLCGGIHAIVLSGMDEELSSLYPPESNVAPSWSVLARVIVEYQDFLLVWMKSPPQTNEVSRSSVIWPAMMEITARFGKPIRLLELGASAGLNLNMDRFGYELNAIACGDVCSKLQMKPVWTGNSARISEPVIRERFGCDLLPVDVSNPKDVLRLRSYVWPDQQERKERLDQALEIAADFPVSVEAEDAVQWLKRELAVSQENVCTVIYSTIAWQYLPEAARAMGEETIKGFGAHANSSSPLVWLKFEADGETPGAGIELEFWPNHKVVTLGRADFHGRWINWFGSPEKLRS